MGKRGGRLIELEEFFSSNFLAHDADSIPLIMLVFLRGKLLEYQSRVFVLFFRNSIGQSLHGRSSPVGCFFESSKKVGLCLLSVEGGLQQRASGGTRNPGFATESANQGRRNLAAKRAIDNVGPEEFGVT